MAANVSLLGIGPHRYKRELKEWDDVLKRKQTEVNEWKR